ncbi:hypothetical protein JTE90_015377 [Oedothorax gibbosus]|uniref:C-type lectin domain-containing protein n=1 Tax=Oedothorax gibbosus TaxID=931172 RepID=A0AAV6U584_9ARAC|nr:hypothetical protein JTE90_015377 [Oedothorax gibbosus]
MVVGKQKTNHFTQKDVFNKEVFYVHNNQEIGPNPKEDSLSFMVTDKIFSRLTSHSVFRLFVTILPQNTQMPRLYFKRAILVDEGGWTAVTEENLSASDEDTFPAELLIVIAKQPTYGYLENSRTTPGFEERGSNQRITAFPLQDVKDGFITFVQHNHSDIEPESDDFEVFVTDGVHNSTSVLVYVSVILLNDEVPFFHLSNITVDEGDSYVMNNDSLSAGDRDYPGDILVLTVKTKPKYGSLTHFLQAVNKGPMLELPFNQLALENFEKIVYRHDGSENFFDSFELSISDGTHSVIRTCFVEVNPLNDEPPVLKKNIPAKNVELQSSFILSNAVLLAEDPDLSNITYKITKSVVFGNLEKWLDGQWLPLNISEFSQEDINQNLIRYQQVSKPSSEYEDSFSFYLSDGVHDSSNEVYTIKLIDHGKNSLMVLAKECPVKYGEQVILNSSLLYASDESSRFEDILFNITKLPTYGYLFLNENASSQFDSFSLFEITNNHLSYKHNPSFKVTNDSFDLQITNGVVVKNLTVNISVTNLNSIPVLKILYPLHIKSDDPKSFVLLVDNLLASKPSLSEEIRYIIYEQPKYGALVYNQNVSHIASFTQSDIENGFISYLPYKNSSKDEFSFTLKSNEEERYFYNGNLFSSPSVFQIFFKPVLEEPKLFINSPTDLEIVWSQHVGFGINSYNLKATYFESSSNIILFTVIRNLESSYLFNVKQQRAVTQFSQAEIDDQLIVLVLKTTFQTTDYFTFSLVVNGTFHKKEYRMDFYWAVVFFPYAEYYACEKDGALNIIIQRSGNLNVSSYVTISGIEQTAKEGLDYVSRRVSKIQFNPGQAEVAWKIIIVRDDLEEAPIEQLQVVLSDSENAIIINYNRTVVSIYDFNTGSCEHVLNWGPQGQMIDANDIASSLGKSEDSEEEGDSRTEVSLNLNFPMNCNENTYGLLHFEKLSKQFFRCDGENWKQWSSKNGGTPENVEVPSAHTLQDYESPDLDVLDVTTKETPETTSQISLLEVDNCLKGWQEFSGKCYKWHKPPAAWDNAAKTCKSYPNGNLVIVESLLHNNWLLQMARSKPFWIGLHALRETNEWTPKHVPFVNWKKGFPRLSGDTKHRCVLVRGSGFWINKNCEGHEHSYICSMSM